MRERRYDIDGLRVGAMLAVFFFHCARFFDGGGWHLKNSEESLVANIFIGLLDLWIMPLFFLLSGTGSWYALKSRTGGQYLLERVKRILIPLYGVGAFVIAVPQLYFEEITNRGYTGTFWAMLPRYFTDVFTTPPNFDDPFFFVVWMGHLWFLQYLFLISLLAPPLLLLLRLQRGQRFIARLAGWCGRWGGILLFLIPLAVVRVAFTHFFEGQEHSWAHFLTFAVFFVIGYIVPADERFTEGIKKVGWFCLALGILGIVGALFILKYYDTSIPYEGGGSFSLLYTLFNTTMSLVSWCWVVFVFSLGAKYLNRPSRMLAYSNEAVLPFYIFHQTVILCVGWFVIRWNIGILPKYLVIAVCSFIIVMALYEGLVRHSNVVRFLFGMRPKKKTSALQMLAESSNS
ncbi:MAG: acyltransferase family protein [Planctomycetota bacterium]|jgi:peptidoglycan/LPS O-acetylase OafA/YrhL